MESVPASRPVVVVDDNPDDIFFFKRCYAKANAVAPLVVASDGEEAIATLDKMVPYASQPHGAPLMVFLDLKLPRVSGFSVLEWIRARREFDAVPVAVLSSSAEPRDVARAYLLGAQTYLVKHPKPADMAAAIIAAAQVKNPSDLAALKMPGLERPKG